MLKSKKIFLYFFALLIFAAAIAAYGQYTGSKESENLSVEDAAKSGINTLSLEYLRSQDYPGSEIVIENVLPSEENYNRYIASYHSQGLKIYALLLVPNGQKPQGGFPVIVLNHGYIIPDKYTPDGNYVPYADAFADAGYIVFKPSYRGHGESEGKPTSAYFSPDYLVDDLNAISSIKKYKSVNPKKIGVWGHSMGGNITFKDVVVDKENIKAAVIWSGVTAPMNEIIYNWQGRVSYKPDALDLRLRYQNLEFLTDTYGSPSENPEFWNSIDPNNYLEDINVPIQIHVGLSDIQVPADFSKGLYERLKKVGKEVEYFEYEGANHDINQSFQSAMKETIDFFNRYLK